MEKNFLVKVINKACCGDRQMKKRILNLLGIDLHKVHYEMFNDKYSKKYYGDDLFLYIDEYNDLIGVSIGAIYQKDFETYSCIYKFDNFRKNRSGLEEHAVAIIRIPSTERYYRPRYNKKYDINNENEKSLNTRLKTFKILKAEKYSDEEIAAFEKEIMTYFTNHLNEKLPETFRKMDVNKNDFASLLMYFAGDMREYEEAKKYLNKEKDKYNASGMIWSKSESWHYGEYLCSKKNIIKWYKCLPEEV